MTATLPYWPVRMSEKLAAAYLDISPSAFRDRVKSRVYPQPVRDGGRVYWARLQLDQYVASQFGLAQNPENCTGVDTWADLR